ncbi:MAG TPA: lipase family protein [Limnobacter sp.]|uniref:lipase family protein n=1 Tax=Limnobacter sp. TaxID=2003368 RepID=UPI002EDAEC5B
MSNRSLKPMEVHALSQFVYEADGTYQSVRSESPGKSNVAVRKEAEFLLKSAAPTKGLQLNTDQFSLLTAKSGLFNLEKLTGFGFVAQGIGGRSGELVLATRGTNFEDNKFDLGTDANCGVSRGPRNLPVHRGFLKTFRGYQQELVHFVTDGGRKRPSTIHCMGHSLGGALANLNAVALYDHGFDVHLYTIGSPRVGVHSFAADITRHIPASKIYRAVNPCDVVPMMPLYPFMHGSSGTSEYLVDNGSDKISLQAHFMSEGYLPMSRKTSWSDFPQPENYLRASIRDLNAELAKVGGGHMFSKTVLVLINRALVELAKALGYVTLICLQSTFSNLFTAADLLSEILTKAYYAGKEFLEAVRSVLNGMLQFMGRLALVQETIEVTTLRWIVNQFRSDMGGRAQQAMNQAMRLA